MRTLLTACLACAALHAQSAGPTIVITGATLIDGTGAQPVRDSVIVVSDGRIAAAGKRSAVQIPPDAKTIDAGGKFVIPGLMDANVHLVLGSSIEFVVRYEGHYEDRSRKRRR